MMITGLLSKGFHTGALGSKVYTGRRLIQTWIVVADREQAYIYRRTTDGLDAIAHAEAKGAQLKSVDDHIFAPQNLNPDDHRPMHGNMSSTDKRSRQLDMAFIHRLAEWLDIAEQESAFDHLILIAAPYTLGNLRSSLTKNLLRRLKGTVNKELTKKSAVEILGYLDSI